MHRLASQQSRPRESPFSAVSFPEPQMDPISPGDGTSSRLSSEFVESHQKQVTSDVLSRNITKRFACTSTVLKPACDLAFSGCILSLMQLLHSFLKAFCNCKHSTSRVFFFFFFLGRQSSTYCNVQVKATARDAGSQAPKAPNGSRFTVVAQPIIVPRMVKPG